MLAQQVAHKYATALFHLVTERGLLAHADKQFEQLDLLVTADPSLRKFLLAPHIMLGDKVAMVRSVFGPRLEPLFVEFLLLLIDKHRAGYLHDIIIEFRRQAAEARNLLEARVVTARPLTDTERAILLERLRMKTGKIVTLKEKVDPAILGGMIVVLKDKIVDGSVRHKLVQLKEELMKVKVA
jgi:F-type H+-transporting ATPase subunit delta